MYVLWVLIAGVCVCVCVISGLKVGCAVCLGSVQSIIARVCVCVCDEHVCTL